MPPDIICNLRLYVHMLHLLFVPQLPGCILHGRPLFHSPRAVGGVLFLEVWVAAVAAAVVVGVSPAALASYDGLTTPRQQKRRLHPPALSISSRAPTLPITRTVPLSAHIPLMAIMDLSKWHPRYLSSPFLFRWANIQRLQLWLLVVLYFAYFFAQMFCVHVHFRETYILLIWSHFCLN